MAKRKRTTNDVQNMAHKKAANAISLKHSNYFPLQKYYQCCEYTMQIYLVVK
jgi:hypothetical protein